MRVAALLLSAVAAFGVLFGLFLVEISNDPDSGPVDSNLIFLVFFGAAVAITLAVVAAIASARVHGWFSGILMLVLGAALGLGFPFGAILASEAIDDLTRGDQSSTRPTTVTAPNVAPPAPLPTPPSTTTSSP